MTFGGFDSKRIQEERDRKKRGKEIRPVDLVKNKVIAEALNRAVRQSWDSNKAASLLGLGQKRIAMADGLPFDDIVKNAIAAQTIRLPDGSTVRARRSDGGVDRIQATTPTVPELVPSALEEKKEEGRLVYALNAYLSLDNLVNNVPDGYAIMSSDLNSFKYVAPFDKEISWVHEFEDGVLSWEGDGFYRPQDLPWYSYQKAYPDYKTDKMKIKSQYTYRELSQNGNNQYNISIMNTYAIMAGDTVYETTVFPDLGLAEYQKETTTQQQEYQSLPHPYESYLAITEGWTTPILRLSIDYIYTRHLVRISQSWWVRTGDPIHPTENVAGQRDVIANCGGELAKAINGPVQDVVNYCYAKSLQTATQQSGSWSKYLDYGDGDTNYADDLYAMIPLGYGTDQFYNLFQPGSIFSPGNNWGSYLYNYEWNSYSSPIVCLCGDSVVLNNQIIDDDDRFPYSGRIRYYHLMKKPTAPAACFFFTRQVNPQTNHPYDTTMPMYMFIGYVIGNTVASRSSIKQRRINGESINGVISAILGVKKVNGNNATIYTNGVGRFLYESEEVQ